MNIHAPTGQPLHIETRGPVAIVTLDNPASRNALSEAMLDALAQTWTRIGADPAIRAVVLAATGKAFSAGHDLKELTAHRSDSDGGRAYFTEILNRCSAMMQQMIALPQPVIAAVEGVATAAGCQLVATCDLAVAGADARFQTPGVHIGLFCSTPMVALSRNVASKHAMEMLLLGELIGAEDAHRFGLVNRVTPAGSALDTAIALAGTIAGKSPLTVKIGKEAFYRQREMTLENAYVYASRVMVENMLARDAKEGIGAFIEKRAPQWSGE